MVTRALCPLLLLASCNWPERGFKNTDVYSGDGECAEDWVVVNSDYASSSVSVVSSSSPEVLAPLLLSSGGAPSGASSALSGDVVTPLETPPSGRLVLIDRYPNSVVTWLNPQSGQVIAQLSVATGFPSNPHDYLEVDAGRAYVSRYESNASPGKQAFDEGGDLLIVDTVSFRIDGRIPLTGLTDGDVLPRADRMIRVGDDVLVHTQNFDRTFRRAAEARVVAIDVKQDRVAWTMGLPGAKSCGGFALSPSGARLALSCSGLFYSGPEQLRESTVVLVDATVRPMQEVRRYDVAAYFGAPVSPSLAFASEDVIVGTTYGNLDENQVDQLFSVDLVSGSIRLIERAPTAFVFGDVRCSPGCSRRCVLADAAENVLRAWVFDGSAFVPAPSLKVDTLTGLPPRSIGGLLLHKNSTAARPALQLQRPPPPLGAKPSAHPLRERRMP